LVAETSGYKKITSQWVLNSRPFSLEEFTVPRHTQQRHNVVNLNNKFSDFHGSHFWFLKPYGDLIGWFIGGKFFPTLKL